MADMYDAMGDFGATGPAEEEVEETETEAPEMDGELMTHAEKLGFTGEQAEALKMFVERCKALADEGAYEEPAAEEEMPEDEDLEL